VFVIELGWNKSCIDVQGRLRTVLFHSRIRPRNSTVRNRHLTSIQDLFQPNSWQTSVVPVTVYSAPDDGRKGRLKHAAHTCSC